MTVDKNAAMLDFLQNCDTIKNNPLFFNFGDVKAGAHQLIVASDDIALSKPYLDGSKEMRYTCSIDCYKSVAHRPVVITTDGLLPDENLGDFSEAQAVLDWVNEMGEDMTFPNFGPDCIVEEMKCTTNKPQLTGVDTSASPVIAIYRVSIRIDYIDNSHRVWN